MAQDLISFLSNNPVDEITEEISIPGRLAQFKFKIKPMTQKQFYKYQQIATTVVPGKSKDVKFNTSRFNELVIVNHVIEPNFKDEKLLSNAGLNTPEEYLNKFFLAGEVANLTEELCLISGFATPDAQLEDEAKNS